MTDTTPEPSEAQLDDIDAIFGADPTSDEERTAEIVADDAAVAELENAHAIEGLTQEEGDAFVEAIEELHQPEPRPRVILSTINDGLGNEQVVGWDTCGKCMKHIRICTCTDGPFRPSYVEKFAFTETKVLALYDDGPDMVSGTMHASADREALESVDVTEDSEKDVITPTGRRRRKDAGKPRGPRNPQATQAAAEDLAAAMKDRSSSG